MIHDSLVLRLPSILHYNCSNRLSLQPLRHCNSGLAVTKKSSDRERVMKTIKMILRGLLLSSFLFLYAIAAQSQVPPSPAETSAYTGYLEAASRNDEVKIKELSAQGMKPDITDGHGRTPLHVAVFGGHHAAMRALVEAGADPNALENDRYDIVTIAAVDNDVPTLKLALELGASAKNITSPYDGTALIAAAHLGHVEVVKILIKAGAPLDHVNNLGWTALIESIVLGDGGTRHTETLRALVAAGADVNLADRNGSSPLSLARSRGYKEMADILESAKTR